MNFSAVVGLWAGDWDIQTAALPEGCVITFFYQFIFVNFSFRFLVPLKEDEGTRPDSQILAQT